MDSSQARASLRVSALRERGAVGRKRVHDRRRANLLAQMNLTIVPPQQPLHAGLVIFPIQHAQPLLAIRDDDHPASGGIDALDMRIWRFSDVAITLAR